MFHTPFDDILVKDEPKEKAHIGQTKYITVYSNSSINEDVDERNWDLPEECPRRFGIS